MLWFLLLLQNIISKLGLKKHIWKESTKFFHVLKKDQVKKKNQGLKFG